MGRISMPQGKGSQMHNRREYVRYDKLVPDNIDVSKSHENVTLVDKDIKQAYREIFGEALEKYNSGQKRADRKIADYYDHILKSKNGEKLFYEDVVQWGSKHDFTSPATREKAKSALMEYVKDFEKRNPNLILVGAYIHMDEASPHLHLDYIPVAHGYKRGLETRNSLDKAMKQMGYVPEVESRKNNATKLWKENERSVFGEICRDMGLEVEQERKSERGSLTVAEYKDARDRMNDEINHEKETLVAEIEPIRQNLARQQYELEQKITRSTEQTKMPKATLGHVKAADAQKLVEENKLLREALTVTAEQNTLLQTQIKILREDKDIMKKKTLEKQYETLKRDFERLKNVVEKFIKSIGADRQFQEFSSLVPYKKMNIRESMVHAERIRAYNLKYRTDVHLKDLTQKRDGPVR